jgi:tetratricopeptide (TPR) repeat protein
MTKLERAQPSAVPMGAKTVQSLKRDLRRIVPLWLVLVILSAFVVALLRFSSVPLIRKIEYGTANPYTLALVYAEEGKKYYEKSLKKIQQQRREGQLKPVLKDDPDVAHARRVFLHSLSLYAESPDIYGYLADLAGFEGNLADVHYYQGALSAARGEPARALEEFDAALKIDPKKREAVLKKAELLIAANRLDEAEQLLTPELDNSSEAYYALARVEAQRRNPQKVVELLKRSISLQPGNALAAKMLADFLYAGDDKEGALKVLRDEERFAPLDANLKHRLGRMLYDMQRYDEAAKVLERAEAIAKFSAPLYLDLARTYHRLGKEQLSAIMFEKAVKLDPTLRDKALFGQ